MLFNDIVHWRGCTIVKQFNDISSSRDNGQKLKGGNKDGEY